MNNKVTIIYYNESKLYELFKNLLPFYCGITSLIFPHISIYDSTLPNKIFFCTSYPIPSAIMLPKYCIALDTPFDSPLTSIPTSGAPEMDHIIMRDEHECDNPKRGFFTRCNY